MSESQIRDDVRQNTGEHRRAVIRNQEIHSRSIGASKAVLSGGNKVNGPPAVPPNPPRSTKERVNSFTSRSITVA
jgi:hypothetical protein